MDKNLLIKSAKQLNIVISDEQADHFETYYNFLIEYSNKFNLTSLKTPVDVIEKHFLDSLSLLPFIDSTLDSVDIGSGAGFPGGVLAVINKNTKYYLVDSRQKVIFFLEQLKVKLGLTNIIAVHFKVTSDEIPPQIEQVNQGFIRAVGSISESLSLARTFIKCGGSFFIMKGPQGSDEYDRFKKNISGLGFRLDSINNLELPIRNQKRIIFKFKKEA